ncbi:MAG: DUF3493 domain-containing protein [Geminocystis sp.]|nr:DUF3493 domain-containing protein [Geminocystis sp.]MCX8077416.1 DUF3493 domain-containing protein [Geminocystis sp.]MDW8117144.1 DUF3493 domain-containing protein [Geminocystis sp.]
MDKHNNHPHSQKYAQLKAEIKAPYKGLRKLFYFTFAASGFIGIFFIVPRIINGQNISENFYNLFVQIAVVTIMVLLYLWEDRDKKK